MTDEEMSDWVEDNIANLVKLPSWDDYYVLNGNTRTYNGNFQAAVNNSFGDDVFYDVCFNGMLRFIVKKNENPCGEVLLDGFTTEFVF